MDSLRRLATRGQTFCASLCSRALPCTRAASRSCRLLPLRCIPTIGLPQTICANGIEVSRKEDRPTVMVRQANLLLIWAQNLVQCQLRVQGRIFAGVSDE